MDMEMKDFTVEVKSLDEEKGIIEGYISTFHLDPDSAGDIVSPGAFAKTIAKHAEDEEPFPVLYGHRTDDPFMNIGVCWKCEEDLYGLKAEIELDLSNPNGAYCYKLAQEKRLLKFSFGYAVKDYDYMDLDGQTIRNLKELDVFEFSLVPIPANQHTCITSVKENEEAEVADGAAAPVLRDEAEELAEKQAEELIENITEPAEEKAEPEAMTFDDVCEAITAAIEPAIEELRNAFAELKSQLADNAEESALSDSEAEIQEMEGDSEEDAADVSADVTAPAQEEKGAPDEELLAKIQSIFDLGA